MMPNRQNLDTSAVWRAIESAPKDREVFFWCVPKTPDEAYMDTSGNSIFSIHEPFLHRGHFGSWSSLSKATHWMPLPSAPGAQQENE